MNQKQMNAITLWGIGLTSFGLVFTTAPILSRWLFVINALLLWVVGGIEFFK